MGSIVCGKDRCFGEKGGSYECFDMQPQRTISRPSRGGYIWIEAVVDALRQYLVEEPVRFDVGQVVKTKRTTLIFSVDNGEKSPYVYGELVEPLIMSLNEHKRKTQAQLDHIITQYIWKNNYALHLDQKMRQRDRINLNLPEDKYPWYIYSPKHAYSYIQPDKEIYPYICRGVYYDHDESRQTPTGAEELRHFIIFEFERKFNIPLCEFHDLLANFTDFKMDIVEIISDYMGPQPAFPRGTRWMYYIVFFPTKFDLRDWRYCSIFPYASP